MLVEKFLEPATNSEEMNETGQVGRILFKRSLIILWVKTIKLRDNKNIAISNYLFKEKLCHFGGNPEGSFCVT